MRELSIIPSTDARGFSGNSQPTKSSKARGLRGYRKPTNSSRARGSRSFCQPLTNKILTLLENLEKKKIKMTLKLLNFKISFWKNAVEINKWIKTINIWGVSISSVVYNIQVNKQLRSRELQSMHFSLISFLSGLLASIYSFTDKVIWNSYQFYQIWIQWTQKPPETYKFCKKSSKK